MTDSEHIPRYARDKTALRGRIHQIACCISVVWLVIYLLNAAYKIIFDRKKTLQKTMLRFDQSQNDTSKDTIYGTISKILILFTQTVLYGCSSFYHLNSYNKWLQKLDHFCIFLFISSVHTSVLLGMKKQKKVQKKEINLPTANELLFKLHPNPFSINSPMRNSKDGRQGIDLSHSRVSFTSECDITHIAEKKNPFVKKAIAKQKEIEETDATFEKSDGKKRDILESSFFDSSFPNSSVAQDESQLDIGVAGGQSDKTTDLSAASTLSSTGSYDDETVTEIERTQVQPEDESDKSSSSFDPSLDTTILPTEISFDETVKEKSFLEEKSADMDETRHRNAYKKQNETEFLQKQEAKEGIAIRWPLYITWGFSLLGFFKIALQKDINELIDVPIYIIHGLHIVFTFQFKRFPKIIVSSFILGGFCYILGGILFGLEFPNFKNKIFGFHEFFHVMTVLGNTCFLVPIIFNWQLIE